MSAPTVDISQRKADHIDLCAKGDVGFHVKTSLFDDVELAEAGVTRIVVCQRRELLLVTEGDVADVQQDVGFEHFFERRAKGRHERVRQTIDEPHRVRDHGVPAARQRVEPDLDHARIRSPAFENLRGFRSLQHLGERAGFGADGRRRDRDQGPPRHQHTR